MHTYLTTWRSSPSFSRHGCRQHFSSRARKLTQRGHLSGMSQADVHGADEEHLGKSPCGWTSQFGILNKSFRHLGTEICAANMPSTSVDLERESFRTSSCRRPAGSSIDAPQKVSWFLRLRCVGSEPWRLVEMDPGRMSTSFFERSIRWLWVLASVFSPSTSNKFACALLERSSAMSLFATSLSRV